uniref:CYTH domain-containing protein n=1 Tax=Cacopsylla melanoneura TaxID=428564 RepID=A0A8D8VI44_9HEMI
MSSTDERNIEIKAKIKNFDDFIRAVKLICDEDGKVLQQEDIFYKTVGENNARLKLRTIKDESSELIYYSRPDQEGPKLSSYSKVNFEGSVDIKALDDVLGKACGRIGLVKKTRHLYLYGQTRIHVDRVQHLGDFMELEVCLEPEQELADGEKIAHQLMEKLGVSKDDLVSCAYMDLLKEKGLAAH